VRLITGSFNAPPALNEWRRKMSHVCPRPGNMFPLTAEWKLSREVGDELI
jgi:hypothetical protein